MIVVDKLQGAIKYSIVSGHKDQKPALQITCEQQTAHTQNPASNCNFFSPYRAQTLGYRTPYWILASIIMRGPG